MNQAIQEWMSALKESGILVYDDIDEEAVNKEVETALKELFKEYDTAFWDERVGNEDGFYEPLYWNLEDALSNPSEEMEDFLLKLDNYLELSILDFEVNLSKFGGFESINECERWRNRA